VSGCFFCTQCIFEFLDFSMCWELFTFICLYSGPYLPFPDDPAECSSTTIFFLYAMCCLFSVNKLTHAGSRAVELNGLLASWYKRPLNWALVLFALVQSQVLLVVQHLVLLVSAK